MMSPLLGKGLQGYMGQIDFLELKGTCENALELNSLLKKEPVDLLFLDIEMPYITGIDFLKNNTHVPRVIFTTAYERYAIQGYELDILDYLLKPISFERFLKAANKANASFRKHQGAGGAGAEDHIIVKADNKTG